MTDSSGGGYRIAYGAYTQGVGMTQPADLENLTELNAVDRLGDRAKENPNSADQHRSENNDGEDGPERRGAVLIPPGSNYEAGCFPHGEDYMLLREICQYGLGESTGDVGEHAEHGFTEQLEGTESRKTDQPGQKRIVNRGGALAAVNKTPSGAKTQAQINGSRSIRTAGHREFLDRLE
jgi:hypothetical protein